MIYPVVIYLLKSRYDTLFHVTVSIMSVRNSSRPMTRGCVGSASHGSDGYGVMLRGRGAEMVWRMGAEQGCCSMVAL